MIIIHATTSIQPIPSDVAKIITLTVTAALLIIIIALCCNATDTYETNNQLHTNVKLVVVILVLWNLVYGILQRLAMQNHSNVFDRLNNAIQTSLNHCASSILQYSTKYANSSLMNATEQLQTQALAEIERLNTNLQQAGLYDEENNVANLQQQISTLDTQVQHISTLEKAFNNVVTQDYNKLVAKCATVTNGINTLYNSMQKFDLASLSNDCKARLNSPMMNTSSELLSSALAINVSSNTIFNVWQFRIQQLQLLTDQNIKSIIGIYNGKTAMSEIETSNGNLLSNQYTVLYNNTVTSTNSYTDSSIAYVQYQVADNTIKIKIHDFQFQYSKDNTYVAITNNDALTVVTWNAVYNLPIKNNFPIEKINFLHGQKEKYVASNSDSNLQYLQTSSLGTQAFNNICNVYTKDYVAARLTTAILSTGITTAYNQNTYTLKVTNLNNVACEIPNINITQDAIVVCIAYSDVVYAILFQNIADSAQANVYATKFSTTLQNTTIATNPSLIAASTPIVYSALDSRINCSATASALLGALEQQRLQHISGTATLGTSTVQSVQKDIIKV
jgi:hypothetical protein